MNLDDLQEDLVTEILKSKFPENYMVYYGVILTLAIQKLIEHNFYEVKQFIDNEISIFKEPKKIIILIDKMMLSNKEQSIAELKKHIDIEKFWNGAQNSRIIKILNQ